MTLVAPSAVAGGALTARERQVLLCYANGMLSPAITRTLNLTVDQVGYASQGIYTKLGVRETARNTRMTKAVAIAWRLCLIEADEIEGGPMVSRSPSRRHVSMDDIEDALLTYRQRTKHLPPPTESWPELRARAHRLAEDYRASKKRRKR